MGGAGAPAHAVLNSQQEKTRAGGAGSTLRPLNKQSGRPPLAETASHSKPHLSLSSPHSSKAQRSWKPHRGYLLDELCVTGLDSTPMKLAQEVVDVLCPPRTVFMIVRVLEDIAGDQRNAAPNSALLMLIYQNVQESFRIEGIIDQQSPATQFGGNGSGLEIGFPGVNGAKLRRQSLR